MLWRKQDFSVEFANSKPESIYLMPKLPEKKVQPEKKKVTLGSKSASERNEVVNFREVSWLQCTHHYFVYFPFLAHFYGNPARATPVLIRGYGDGSAFLFILPGMEILGALRAPRITHENLHRANIIFGVFRIFRKCKVYFFKKM